MRCADDDLGPPSWYNWPGADRTLLLQPPAMGPTSWLCFFRKLLSTEPGMRATMRWDRFMDPPPKPRLSWTRPWRPPPFTTTMRPTCGCGPSAATTSLRALRLLLLPASSHRRRVRPRRAAGGGRRAGRRLIETGSNVDKKMGSGRLPIVHGARDARKQPLSVWTGQSCSEGRLTPAAS